MGIILGEICFEKDGKYSFNLDFKSNILDIRLSN